MLDPLAVVTPWFPTAQRPFHGSFVKAFADAVHEAEGRPVHVYHLEAWGLPRGGSAARRAKHCLGELMGGPARRVPLRGDGIRTVHLPAPVAPGATFGEIAHGHHRFLDDVLPGVIDEPLVHAHVGLGGGWPALAMMPVDTPLFVTEHATFLDRLLEERDARERYDQVIARSHRFFCVSEGLRDRLLSYFPHREAEVDVLPNPIRFDEIPRRRRPLDPDLRRWLYVGYLTERKGVLQLLQAFAIAQSRHGDLSLSLVGEGPLEERLRARASELGVSSRVELRGPVPHERIHSEYEDHDLLVHLSDYETFGMTVVEAVAVGLPVIVTASGGPEETVGPVIDQVGRLVAVEREPEEVADAYRSLRDGVDGLDLVAGRSSLEGRYSFPTVGRALEQHYQDGGEP